MHVVVNAAISADGKLSSRRREQIAISGPEDFERVDRLRADSDAVMVGAGTVRADDPSLTLDVPSRRAEGNTVDARTHPARVVADSRARTPLDARVLTDDSTTYLLVSRAAPVDRVTELADDGVRIITAGEERVDLSAAFDALEAEGIDQLMVEGGGELIFSLFDEELVDELSVFVGGRIIGGADAPTLADGTGFVEDFPELELADIERLDDGAVLTWHPSV